MELPSTVPHHGGSPSEMLRDLADFLDRLDDAGALLEFRGGRYRGQTLAEVLYTSKSNERTMQEDVRWLAERLDANSPQREN